MIKSKSQSKNAPQDIHLTAKNKIRHILASIKVSGGKHLEVLIERLKFWEGK